MASSVMHMRDGCDYKEFMRNSSILATVYPHQRKRARGRGELVLPRVGVAVTKSAVIPWEREMGDGLSHRHHQLREAAVGEQITL